MPANSPIDPAAEQLFRAVRERDEGALAQFVQRLSPWLAGEVRRAGARGIEVDEVVQDTWVAAIAAVDEHRAGVALLPWLAAVARHRVVSLRRSQRRRARLHAAGGEALLHTANAHPSDVVALVRGREALLAVRQAVADQPEPYREVLRLHLFEGLPPHEIAQRLRLGRVGVRVRLYRALRRLRRSLPDALALVLLAALTRQGTSQAPLWVGAAAALAIGSASYWHYTGIAADGGGAAASGAAPASLLADAVAPQQMQTQVDRERDRALPPDEVLVRVVDDTGQGLGSVGVTLAPLAGVDPLLSERRLCTDAEGTVRFMEAPAGRLRIRCDRGATTTLEAGCREAVLRAIGGMHVHGRVVDPAGSPIAGARIWLAGPDAERRDGAEVAITSNDGMFELRAVAPGSSLAVRAEGRAGTRLRSLRTGDLGNLVLEARGGAAAIAVSWPDGSPCDGATVVLGHADIGTLPNDESPALMPAFVAHTDRSGRWAATGIETGFLPLVVRAPDAAPFCTTIAIAADTETTIQVQLLPGTSLRGRIVDLAGRAVAGARIACRADATFGAVDARSADDGTFFFASLPRGTLGLLVWAPDCPVVEQVLTLDRDPRNVEVRVEPRPRRRGRVVTSSGEALAGWELSLPLQQARSTEDGSVDVAADASGAVDMAAPSNADWSQLLIRPPTSIFWALAGGLREDLPDGSFVIRVPPTMCTAARLRGRITADGGEPIANATLVAYGSGNGRVPVGTTDTAGRFDCGPLPAGDYQLSVEAPHAGVPALDLPLITLEDGELEILDVVAPTTGRVHYTLQFADGRRPHAPVVRIASRDNKRLRAELFGATGEQALLPGEYSASTMGDDFVWRTESFTVRAGERTEWVATVVPAAQRQFSLRHLPVAHGGELRGRFFDMVSGSTLYAFRVPLDKAFPLPLTSFLPIGAIGCEARTSRGERLRAQFEITDLRPSFDVLELGFHLQDPAPGTVR